MFTAPFLFDKKQLVKCILGYVQIKLENIIAVVFLSRSFYQTFWHSHQILTNYDFLESDVHIWTKKKSFFFFFWVLFIFVYWFIFFIYKGQKGARTLIQKLSNCTSKSSSDMEIQLTNTTNPNYYAQLDDSFDLSTVTFVIGRCYKQNVLWKQFFWPEQEMYVLETNVFSFDFFCLL